MFCIVKVLDFPWNIVSASHTPKPLLDTCTLSLCLGLCFPSVYAFSCFCCGGWVSTSGGVVVWKGCRGVVAFPHYPIQYLLLSFRLWCPSTPSSFFCLFCFFFLFSLYRSCVASVVYMLFEFYVCKMSSLVRQDGMEWGTGWPAGRTDVALCRPPSIVCKFLVQSTKYPQPVKYLVCVFLLLRVRAVCSGF